MNTLGGISDNYILNNNKLDNLGKYIDILVPSSSFWPISFPNIERINLPDIDMNKYINMKRIILTVDPFFQDDTMRGIRIAEYDKLTDRFTLEIENILANKKVKASEIALPMINLADCDRSFTQYGTHYQNVFYSIIITYLQELYSENLDEGNNRLDEVFVLIAEK